MKLILVALVIATLVMIVPSVSTVHAYHAESNIAPILVNPAEAVKEMHEFCHVPPIPKDPAFVSACKGY